MFAEMYENDKLKFPDRQLSKMNIIALVTFRYYLEMSIKNPGFYDGHERAIKKLVEYILENELGEVDLPPNYDTFDEGLLKLIIKGLKRESYRTTKRVYN